VQGNLVGIASDHKNKYLQTNKFHEFIHFKKKTKQQNTEIGWVQFGVVPDLFVQNLLNDFLLQIKIRHRWFMNNV